MYTRYHHIIVPAARDSFCCPAAFFGGAPSPVGRDPPTKAWENHGKSGKTWGKP